MIEQIVIMFLLILNLCVTIYLNGWKMKKEKEYKNDERWLLVQIKAKDAANYSNTILYFLILFGYIAFWFFDFNITLAFDRALSYLILLLSLRNYIEIFALRYYDKRL
jgi:hypothetical protein